jgi:hypothetical protein
MYLVVKKIRRWRASRFSHARKWKPIVTAKSRVPMLTQSLVRPFYNIKQLNMHTSGNITKSFHYSLHPYRRAL